MAKILHPETLTWDELLRHPWQWVLFCILLAASASGLIYVAYSITIRFVQRYKSHNNVKPTISTKTSRHLNLLTEKLPPRSKPESSKVTSFGVYLGDFSLPPTEAQIQFLNRSDLIILDPFRGGVGAAVRSIDGGRVLVGRVDLATFLAMSVTPAQAVSDIANLILRSFSETPFTGVLLSGWEQILPHDHLVAISTFISVAGLLVYLEISPPIFLQNTIVLEDSAIAGLVVRNAAILPNGEHRDYFDMEKLQPSVRAWVRQSCLRDFKVMAWEAVEDDVEVSNAVIKRAIQWNSFYSAITWIGPNASLTDAEVNQPIIEPLGAFEWLKDEIVMTAHSKWRANNTITYRMNRYVLSELYINMTGRSVVEKA